MVTINSIISAVSSILTIIGIVLVIVGIINFKKIKDKKVLKNRLIIGCVFFGIGFIVPSISGRILFSGRILNSADTTAIFFHNFVFLVFKLIGTLFLLLCGIIRKPNSTKEDSELGVCTCCNRSMSFFKLPYEIPDFNGRKHKICAECWNRAEKEGKDFKWNPEKGVLELVDKDEAKIIKKCNDCGHIFTYTAFDVKRNENQRTTAGVQALVGNSYDYHQANNKIRDFNRCPKCDSSDLRQLTVEEYKIEREKRNNPTQSNVSSADELKKFKDLLDSGIITQEEFDAKKKQLLGL